jgi:CheY-like chemotaxis protein
MGKRRITDTLQTVPDVAEGRAEIENYKEPHNPTETSTIPVIKVNPMKAPSAETGLVSAVLLQAEGSEDDTVRDASRITDETQPNPIPENTGTTAGRSPSVLIIEDTTELAEVIQATLERMNMVTAHETHGSKGLARFNQLKPDIVLLDIGLPDMTGWKFLEAIKETHKDKLPIVIVITAYGDPANRLVAKFQGVYDYLIKPFTSSEVERVVSGALSSKHG